jgi:hypothetical protein
MGRVEAALETMARQPAGGQAYCLDLPSSQSLVMENPSRSSCHSLDLALKDFVA